MIWKYNKNIVTATVKNLTVQPFVTKKKTGAQSLISRICQMHDAFCDSTILG